MSDEYRLAPKIIRLIKSLKSIQVFPVATPANKMPRVAQVRSIRLSGLLSRGRTSRRWELGPPLVPLPPPRPQPPAAPRRDRVPDIPSPTRPESRSAPIGRPLGSGPVLALYRPCERALRCISAGESRDRANGTSGRRRETSGTDRTSGSEFLFGLSAPHFSSFPLAPSLFIPPFFPLHYLALLFFVQLARPFSSFFFLPFAIRPR
jgi:hypothetical protein